MRKPAVWVTSPNLGNPLFFPSKAPNCLEKGKQKSCGEVTQHFLASGTHPNPRCPQIFQEPLGILPSQESRGLCNDSPNVGKVLFSASLFYCIFLKQVVIPWNNSQRNEIQGELTLEQKSCQPLNTQYNTSLDHKSWVGRNRTCLVHLVSPRV